MSERYPLWCLDNSDRFDEQRYRGPFETKIEAIAAQDRAVEETGVPWRIRRCRRLLLSEVIGFDALEHAVEEADERLGSGDYAGPAAGWARWDDSILSVKPDVGCDPVAAVLDRYVQVDAYICEGDEAADTQGGTSG